MPNTLANPKLRSVDPVWVQQRGDLYLQLRDPLELTDRSVLVPRHLAPLLALCDGTRDLVALRTGLALRTGVRLSDEQVRQFVEGLDSALLIENETFKRASDAALRAYRRAKHRKPSRADQVYPSDREALAEALEQYGSEDSKSSDALSPPASLVGVVSPHIDYQRGGETYAELWRRCAPALVVDVELAIIFGTDHAGDSGSLTLTRQSYATPMGELPTDQQVVDGLADVLGPDHAFADEIHHVHEHSIELASVWFHYYTDGRSCPVVPILCGSFADFVFGRDDPKEHEAIGSAMAFLKEAMHDRKTLVIAAADLAHAGPAFGDPQPLDQMRRAKLAADDARSIAAICDGDADEFFEISRAEGDARKICGLPPIYMALRLLDGVKGESMGYAQCPADANGGSVVSIAGVMLWEPPEPSPGE